MQPCGRPRKTPSSSRVEPDLNWREALNDYLKREGLRSTKQREIVAGVALNRKNHFEIQELIKEVQQKHPEISPATVYRSVKTLCEAGILSETFQSDGGVTLYEPYESEHHDHIVCLDCGEIFEFIDESLEAAQEKATNRLGFKAERHHHVIYARCSYLKK